MTKTELLTAWIEGRYALGWRGHLAMWLIRPAVNEMLVKENDP